MNIPESFKPKHGTEEKTQDLLEGRIKELDKNEQDEVAYRQITYNDLTPEKLDKIKISDNKIVSVRMRIRGRGRWEYLPNETEELEYNNQPKELTDALCVINCYSAIGASKEEANVLFEKIKRLHNIKHGTRIETIKTAPANKKFSWYQRTNLVMPPLKREDIKKILTEVKNLGGALITYENVTYREYRNTPVRGSIILTKN